MGSLGALAGTGSQSNGVSVSKVTEEIDGESVKITTIKDKKFEVIIRESSDDGIEIRIRESRMGKDKITDIQVDDLESLERDHPEAFQWYRKYAGDQVVSALANPLVNGLSGIREGKLPRTQATSIGEASGIGATERQSRNALPVDARQAMEQQIQELIQNADGNPLLKLQLQQMLEGIRRNNP